VPLAIKAYSSVKCIVLAKKKNMALCTII